MENETFTPDAETASVGTSDKANTAILRIAYLIAASDGEVKQSERDVFKTTLCALQGLKMGDDDTTALIQGVVQEAAGLAILRDFYNEEELIKAFLSKVAGDVTAIQRSKLACRRAFAAWISICMADKEFSPFERKLIKTLQAACNGLAGVSMMASGAGIGAGLGFFLGGPILGAAAAIAGAALGAKKKGTPESAQKFGPDARIPDAFIEEVESRCREIDEAQAQLGGCTADDERRAIEDSIQCLVESFKEFIDNVEA